jgi:hypothetical protein
MADAKISALTAVSSATGSLELGAADAGLSRKVTDQQIVDLFEDRKRQGVLLKHSVDQTVGSSNVDLAWDTEIFKVGKSNRHSVSEWNDRINFIEVGQYFFFAHIEWEPIAADVMLEARVLQAWSTLGAIVRSPSINDASVGTIQCVSGFISTGSFIGVQVSHDRGGSLTLDVKKDRTRFGLYLIGR